MPPYSNGNGSVAVLEGYLFKKKKNNKPSMLVSC